MAELQPQPTPTSKQQHPNTFLVQFRPDGHRTFRISVIGRELEKAQAFAAEMKVHEATDIRILELDGLTGEIEMVSFIIPSV